MKKVFFTILSILMASHLNAFAKESIPVELKDIGIEEKLGQQVDLNLTFRNELGEIVPLSKYFHSKKPVMLLMAYYQCPNLCNLFLNGVSESLKSLKWTAGQEFELVTVSINPSEEPNLAKAKKANHLKQFSTIKANMDWHFLVNDTKLDVENINHNAKKLSDQVGFRYKWNKETNQYAHSAGVVFLTPKGVVSRYLYGIQYAEKDLKLALSEASGNRIGTLTDRLVMFCYNYDPKGRTYSFTVLKVTRAIAVITILFLGVWVYIGNRKKKTKAITGKEPNDRMTA